MSRAHPLVQYPLGTRNAQEHDGATNRFAMTLSACSISAGCASDAGTAPLALLHASLLVRPAGDLAPSIEWRV